MIPREMVTLMERRRLVAEVRTDTAVQALGVVDALAVAGVSSIEIALTIPGAHEILTHLATRQDVLIGAGSVLDPRQASEAISCGARFIASPIVAPELVPVCRDANVACILGGLTPTEIITAQRAGAEMVKLFPAEALGGPQYVRGLLRQLTHVSLQISGGITAENLGEYLALPVRTLAVGTLLVPPMLVERNSWQAITARARAFVEYVANPHANAARFLAAMGIAPRPQPAAVDPVKAVIAAVPTINVPPAAAAAVAAAQVAMEPAASESGFKPWDSRPVNAGDDEDWLR
jgi:2-dehydro-3-deoxyphosphogluconate aldolase/(4S)-4-hydroxy-2-oxoglutarate aldolase